MNMKDMKSLGARLSNGPKPKANEAPSNLAIIGRYVLTPEIFSSLDAIGPGFLGPRGGIGEHLDQVFGILRRHHLEGDILHIGEVGIGDLVEQEAVHHVARLGR